MGSMSDIGNGRAARADVVIVGGGSAGGAVKGIDGLRVVDASIMPVVPSVALNPTTIMIAERIAKAVYTSERGPSTRGVQVAPMA